MVLGIIMLLAQQWDYASVSFDIFSQECVNYTQKSYQTVVADQTLSN